MNKCTNVINISTSILPLHYHTRSINPHHPFLYVTTHSYKHTDTEGKGKKIDLKYK